MNTQEIPTPVATSDNNIVLSVDFSMRDPSDYNLLHLKKETVAYIKKNRIKPDTNVWAYDPSTDQRVQALLQLVSDEYMVRCYPGTTEDVTINISTVDFNPSVDCDLNKVINAYIKFAAESYAAQVQYIMRFTDEPTRRLHYDETVKNKIAQISKEIDDKLKEIDQSDFLPSHKAVLKFDFYDQYIIIYYNSQNLMCRPIGQGEVWGKKLVRHYRITDDNVDRYERYYIRI